MADAFVTKINPTGTALVYSTYLRGSGDDAAYGVAVDNNDEVLVVGVTNSSDFPVTTGAFQKTYTAPPAMAATSRQQVQRRGDRLRLFDLPGRVDRRPAVADTRGRRRWAGHRSG